MNQSDGKHQNVIGLAATGSGKTGAFGIPSVMRIDRNNQKLQIVVIAHSRELCNQIFEVY